LVLQLTVSEHNSVKHIKVEFCSLQGNQKEKEPLPEKSHVFSDNVPNTNSGNYGNRITTSLGQSMAQMEYQFYSGGRRKKLGNDMICY